MKKLLLLCIAFAAFTTVQAQNSLWVKDGSFRTAGAELSERGSMPVKYAIYRLNLPVLKALLQQAPSRESEATSDVIIEFPVGNSTERFRIYEASVLHPELAAQHPEIGSYAGQGIDNPLSSIRLSVTPFGVHTMIFSGSGTFYTDTYTKDLKHCISYHKTDLPRVKQFSCGVDGTHAARQQEENVPWAVDANDGKLRKYRLAMASTIEYSAFHINAAGQNGGTLAQKKAAVLAAMTVTMTRVNFIYERDLAVTMQLIPNNTDLIFVTSDNLTNDDSLELIDEIQAVINGIVGSAAYDIGHVVSTGEGGVATFQSVCKAASKAEGVTGTDQPVGDAFDVDYVAHEMGHQFGGNHTFNANTGSCQGNRNAGTAAEPGSGNTIMAYAGICGSADVQPNSDAHFHAISLGEMFSYITTGATCAVVTNNNNTPPVIPAFTNITVPKSTPFMLSGSATDANGDALTYCWEQIDTGGGSATAPSSSATAGPVFKSYPPMASPNRYFPTLPNSTSTQWEVLPSVARTLNFALTVRDNRTPNGGQTARRDMVVTVNNATGPFAVTSQSAAGVSYAQNSTQTITWNVAGTTGAPINTANVNILLSTDGGLTFPTTLVANTPNDGSQSITIPNVAAAPYCYVMVQSVGNIFYSLNSQPFSIGGTVSTVCNSYAFNTPVAIQDAATGLTGVPINVPATAAVTDLNVSVNITHTALGNLFLLLQSPNGVQADLWNNQCGSNDNMNITFDDAGSAVVCATPTTGNRKPVDPLSVYNGMNPAGAWLFGFGDFIAGNTGTLNSVSLQICSQQFLATNELTGLDGFMIYPNPGNGNFTVDFISATGNDIAVVVHDMRGRQVYNKRFANTGAFSGNINLAGVQSGVYLVAVEDGARKEVRKVVVQ